MNDEDKKAVLDAVSNAIGHVFPPGTLKEGDPVDEAVRDAQHGLGEEVAEIEARIIGNAMNKAASNQNSVADSVAKRGT